MADFTGISRFTRQRGAIPPAAIAAIVVAIIAILLFALNSGDDEDETAPQTAAPVAPPPVKPVDLASAPTQKAGGTEDGKSEAEKLERLYREGQTKRPFEDGYESEDVGRPVATPMISAFDYGVLDGRVRVGVFGNGSIPKYTTRQTGDEFIIEMPGEYKFFRPLERRLPIDAYRVNVARLETDASGMRIKISTSPPLEHEPFIIEDTYGLMLAFEPRR